MKPRITLVTIGVDDLDKSLRFYRDGLGLASDGIVGEEFENGAVAFFELKSGLRLALWPRKSIALDSGLPQTPRSATEFTLGHNVSSKSEVDSVMQEAKAAGAVIVKLAQDTFWGGYAGYFRIRTGTYGRWPGTRNGICRISISQIQFRLNSRVTDSEAKLKSCPKCGAQFSGDADLCRRCRLRLRLDEASSESPGRAFDPYELFPQLRRLAKTGLFFLILTGLAFVLARFLSRPSSVTPSERQPTPAARVSP